MTTVLTPTFRQGGRRALFWIGAAIAIVALAFVVLALNGSASSTDPLSPESAAPDGTLALAEVLRQQGVDVVVTGSLEETVDAVNDADATTILLDDAGGYLTDRTRQEVAALSDNLVLLRPDIATLDLLAPGVDLAGSPDDDPLEPGCENLAAVEAETVSPGGSSYRVSDDGSEGSIGDGVEAESCLRSESSGADDAYSFIRLTDGDSVVSVLGATDALTNAQTADEGNAAFALTLLGQHPTLVWYLPSVADVDEIVDPAAFTPGWVTPVIVLAFITAIAAAIWRGRRFGPLIVENLPVVVRSSETMEGRARLYERGSSRLRALDALRIGTVSRLATASGLGSSAGIEDIVLAVAGILGRDQNLIRAILLDAVPATDRELISLSDALLELEASVASLAPR